MQVVFWRRARAEVWAGSGVGSGSELDPEMDVAFEVEAVEILAVHRLGAQDAPQGIDGIVGQVVLAREALERLVFGA